MSVTVRALIRRALQSLGVLGEGETPTATAAQDALYALNEMLDEWRAERLTLYSQQRDTLGLTVNQQRYTLGPGGDIDRSRPLWIDSLGLIEGGTERPIELLTFSKWARIAVKTLPGTPDGALYDAAFPLGTLDVWPIPSHACTLVVYAPGDALTGAASLDTVISQPPGWAAALRYNLALRLAPEYGRQPDPAIVTMAVDSKATIKRANETLDTLVCDSAIVHPADFDIRIGE